MSFDPYHQWLAIPRAEQPPHHYRLLGLALFEEDANVIEHAADRQMAHLRSFQTGKHGAESQRLLNEVSAARLCLLDPKKKAVYDAKLRDRLEVQEGPEEGYDAALADLLERAGDSKPTSERKKGTTAGARPSRRVGGLSSTRLKWGAAIGGAALVAAIAVLVWASRSSPAPGSKPPGRRPTPSPQVAKAISKPEFVMQAPRADEATSGPRPKADDSPSETKASQRLPEGEPVVGTPATKGEMAAASTIPVAPSASAPAVVDPPPGRDGGAPSSAVGVKKEASPVASTVSAAAPQIAPSRVPVPAAAAREEALRQAQALYREEYRGATTAPAREALAKKILQDSLDGKLEPASQYALLSLARDVASTAGDLKLAFQAIEELGERFEQDPWPLKAEVLVAQARAAKTPDQRRGVIEEATALVEASLDEGQSEAAGSFWKLAQTEAGKLRDRALAQRLRDQKKAIDEAAGAAAELRRAHQSIKENESDPSANLALGRYLALTKGDWDAALPRLAAGGDAAMKSLAALEIELSGTRPPPPAAAPPATVAGERDTPKPEKAQGAGAGDSGKRPKGEDYLKLADGWWDRAERERGRAKDLLLAHSGIWYRRALETADSTLVRTRIEKRLAVAGAAVARRSTRPLPLASPFDVATARRAQEGWARALGTTLETTNSLGMRLVLIPPGEFDMGSPPEEVEWALAAGQTGRDETWYVQRVPAEGPRHRVRITRPFWLGVFEVTQAEWMAVMKENPSSLSASGKEAERVAGQDTSRHPVEMVSWEDAQAFLEKLNGVARERAAGRVYRLPTEAEWEYACHAGTVTRWYTGSEERSVEAAAWFLKNARGQTHPVGQKQPNALGLFDMHGNVWEWCNDWFGEDYYRESPGNDPPGAAKGVHRVYRGGTWKTLAAGGRAAFRSHYTPSHKSFDLGLRVAAEAGGAAK